MNFRCIAILFILIGFMIASAHGQEITILPYLQNTSPNSTYILWEVDAFGRGEVIYGKDPRALNKSKKSIRSNTDSKHQLHAALIKNLKSNTKYYYRVLMGDGNTSELYSFKTPEVFRSRNATQFILLSNIERHQALPTIFKEICNDGILQKSEDEIGLNPSDLEAILISGDMSNPGIEGYRDHFFKHGKDILPYVPYYVIPGENEYLDDSLKNFVHFNRLPKNGPKTLNQRVWYKDISNIRIIAVDTHLKGKEQAICKSWLEELLEKSCSYESIDFILLMMYHPSRSEFRPKPKPIFARYLIQQLDAFANRCDKLVVHSSGEDHGYSKGFSNEARHVWISPGSAAGVLDEWGIQKNIDVEEYSVSTDDYGFVLLNFTADELPKVTFKRYSRGNDRMGQRNALKDHFTVQKIASKPSQPIGIYPNKDSILNQCIRLKAAPFNDGNAKAITSQWQIAKESDFNRKLYKDLLIHHLTEFRGVREEGVDLSTIEIAGLEKEENYFWRMRYRNSDLMWSDWSRPKSFYLKEGNNELSENLVFNPDAEMGPDGWSGDIEHLKYGRCNTGRAYEGLSHFSAGGVCLNELDTSYAYQDIPLSMFPNGVQSNSIVAELSAYLRNFNGADIAEMYLEFYNTYGDYIQQSNVLSHNTPYWTLKSDVIKIPEGTASCRIILRGIRISGKSNDAYFDNLSLKISNAENCFVCVGNSNIDNDNDGFCSDQDCNDDDPSFYPGANEICDQKDNDCDGYADNGNIVQWTGAGVNNLWSNLRNWSQNELPLPCQKVIINTKDSIIVDGNMICKNLEIGEESILLINPNAQLTLTEKINMPVIYNKGTMLVNGSCTIHTNADGAIKLSGDLFVKGQINSKVVIEEQLEILGKGQYKNFQYSN